MSPQKSISPPDADSSVDDTVADEKSGVQEILIDASTRITMTFTTCQFSHLMLVSPIGRCSCHPTGKGISANVIFSADNKGDVLANLSSNRMFGLATFL